ncbi:hypothetical protein DBR42_07065, partial [Pelomonas sp. HMWF004]
MTSIGDMRTSAFIAGAVVLATLATGVALEVTGWPGLAPRLAQRVGQGLQVDSGTRLHLLWRPRLEAPQLRLVSADGQTLAQA